VPPLPLLCHQEMPLQASADSLDLAGTVRSIIKENDKKAVRLARKREKKSE